MLTSEVFAQRFSTVRTPTPLLGDFYDSTTLRADDTRRIPFPEVEWVEVKPDLYDPDQDVEYIQFGYRDRGDRIVSGIQYRVKTPQGRFAGFFGHPLNQSLTETTRLFLRVDDIENRVVGAALRRQYPYQG